MSYNIFRRQKSSSETKYQKKTRKSLKTFPSLFLLSNPLSSLQLSKLNKVSTLLVVLSLSTSFLPTRVSRYEYSIIFICKSQLYNKYLA